MSGTGKRQVFGIALRSSRALGLLLIVIAILGLPQMRFVTGRFAEALGTIMSVALALVGVTWLFGVEMFLHFFDRYLSRN